MEFKSSVKPIIGPSIMWDSFIKDTYDLTNSNPAKVLDGCKLDLNTMAKFIIALESFRGNTKQPLESLSLASIPLEHLFFGFLITAPSVVIMKLNEETTLNVISSKTKIKSYRSAVVSGTLGEWKNSIASICAFNNISYTSTELRHIANICLEYFSNMGLKMIFKSFNNKKLSDGTYLLESK